MAGELKFKIGDRVRLDRMPSTHDTPGFGTITHADAGGGRAYYSIDADMPNGHKHPCSRNEGEMTLIEPLPDTNDPEEIEQWLER